MDNLLHFYKGFIQRKGNYVFIATVVSRLLSLIASYIAIKLIGKTELGYVIYALNIMTFIIPLSGLGLQQSLLRFGARLSSTSAKKALFSFVFKKGILISILISIILFLLSGFLTFKLPEASYFLKLFSLLLITSFLLEILKIQFRLEHNNKQFAYVEILYNVILVICVFVLGYYFKEFGYSLAILIAPLITFLFFIKSVKINFRPSKLPIKIDYAFIKYGFYAGLANTMTQLLFAIDILLVGTILKDPSLVTAFKYISLIPFSLLFFPNIILTTDFVTLTENIYNREYLKKYNSNYKLLFLIFCSVIAVIFFVFSESILNIFDRSYQIYSIEFLVLTVGVFSILLFRSLYGNLISALGKAHINYYIALSILLLNIPANYYLIPRYGILGAVITSSTLMWFSSLLTYFIFKMLYKKGLN